MAKKRGNSGRKGQSRPRPATRGSRRRWVWALAATAAVVAGVVVLWSMLRPRPVPPTVVVFVLDTVRRDALGCYGHPAEPTPNIDAVAGDGVKFERVVSTSGWTLPAVASLMTGTWPTVHGAMGRGVRLTPVREELPMAAEVFQRAGFETVGFANAAFVSPMLGLDRGFDVFDHRYSYNWDTRRADDTIDAAIEQLRERRSSPCFYFIHLFDPHLDYDAPAPFTERFTGGRGTPPTPLTLQDVLELQTGPEQRDPPSAGDIRYVRGTYDAEVAFTDAHVGRFIDELKALGLYERSTVVITADHGEEFWDHGGFEHGHTLYDELVMVPLIMKLPAGEGPAVRAVDSQVRLLDVMPTVFELAGVEVPATFEGVSLMPFIRGESDRDLTGLSESTLYGPSFIALRGPRYKFIQELGKVGKGGEALFDWRTDPGETTDLSARLPEVARELKSELARIHGENVARARRMSQPKVVDLSPTRIRQLRSLGYIR